MALASPADLTLLVAGATALLAMLVQAIYIGVLNKRLQALQRLVVEQQDEASKKMDALTQQVELLNRGSLGVGKRLMATEKRLNQTMERQEEIESKEWEQASFTQASRLIEKGVAVHEVVDKAGISRSEARLVDLVRRKSLQPHD
jgi:hypothetical protein